MYPKRKIWNLEREAQINKIERIRSAAVATKPQKELDIAKLKPEKLREVVTTLQRTLNRLENLRSSGVGL